MTACRPTSRRLSRWCARTDEPRLDESLALPLRRPLDPPLRPPLRVEVHVVLNVLWKIEAPRHHGIFSVLGVR